jgi:hypothetical protein
MGRATLAKPIISLIPIVGALLLGADPLAVAQSPTTAARLEKRVAPASYDPLPPSWNIIMNIPGWLSVGAEYCTQQGDCKTLGDGPDGLGPIPLKDGGTAPPSIGCRENPEYPACISARVPVELLARSQSGAVIARMDGRNYAIGGMAWSYERPDGSAIGGPIMITAADGEVLPLHNALRGLNQKAFQAAQQRVDDHRKATVAGILRAKQERCDQLITVTKTSEGSFSAACLVNGRQKTYIEGISGLD